MDRNTPGGDCPRRIALPAMRNRYRLRSFTSSGPALTMCFFRPSSLGEIPIAKPSGAHTDADVEQTVAAIQEVAPTSIPWGLR